MTLSPVKPGQEMGLASLDTDTDTEAKIMLYLQQLDAICTLINTKCGEYL